MARHALFPETMVESNNDFFDDESDSNDEVVDDTVDDLESLLATLEGWNSSDTPGQKLDMKKTTDSTRPFEGKLCEELQVWRSKHQKRKYDEWTSEEKQKFGVS